MWPNFQRFVLMGIAIGIILGLLILGTAALFE